MATVTLNATNSGAVTITIASLTNNSTATSNAIDNSTNKYVGAVVRLKVKSGASGTSATGLVNVYIVRSTDGGTDYSDATDQLIGSVPVVANATTYARAWYIEPLGTHWKLVVENKSGGTLDSTGGNHEMEFSGLKYDVA